MLFTHDVIEALESAVDLVNSGARGEERLSSADEVWEFAMRHNYSVQPAGSKAELDRMRCLRGRLREAWVLADQGLRDEVVAWLNAAIDDSAARPLLTRHGEWDWHLHFTPLGAPIDQQTLAEVAMAIVTLFREGELERLKLCAGEGCDAVLVDLSRNRSKRFCDVGNCGNRANVAAYRARKSAAN